MRATAAPPIEASVAVCAEMCCERPPQGSLAATTENRSLLLLAIPHSSAKCERVFSTVKKTRTEFRSSLSNKTLGDHLMVKGDQTGHCFEQLYSDNFLKLAKSATTRSLHK